MPTTSFRFNSVDLDALFEPIGSSSKRADVNYTVGGTDISNYYYSVTNGGKTFGTTNFNVNGIDIGTLFAASGSVQYDRFLYAWGLNSSGQTTFQTQNFSWTSVSAGYRHTAAIRSDGLLFTWGSNSNGQLGDGTTVNKSSPVQIGGNLGSIFSPVLIGTSSWTSVSAGGTHTAAIRSGGSLFTWGQNNYGQLGDATLVNKSSPVLIGTRSWTGVAAGAAHTAAIRSDGLLFTWGVGSNGRLGDGTTVSKSSPVQIGSSSWTSVSAGARHTAAIRSDRRLFTWGYNNIGQLGDGTIVSKSSPVQIGSSSWTSVSAGELHTLSL